MLFSESKKKLKYLILYILTKSNCRHIQHLTHFFFFQKSRDEQGRTEHILSNYSVVCILIKAAEQDQCSAASARVQQSQSKQTEKRSRSSANE